MGKRSDFERVERDFYPTPLDAVKPLIPHLPDEFLKILNTLGDENVFVISHKQDVLADKFKSTIKFEKVKNFSHVVT